MNKLTVKIGNKLFVLSKEDIIYLEQEGRKVLFNTCDTSLETSGKLIDYENKLGENFYRCHSFCIVNLDKIISLEDLKINFVGGMCVYLGRTNMLKVKRAIRTYMD